MKHAFFNSLIAFLLLTQPAYATDILPPTQFSGTYQFTLAGIPFGRAEIDFSQSAEHYKAKSTVQSIGLARLFVQHDSLTASLGSGADFHYANSLYESDYATRKKKKYVKMVRENNVIAKEIITPPDNRQTRPAVDAALKKNAVDPLEFGLMMRVEAARALAENKNSFSINYYDGRRLMQVDFSVVGNKLIRINGKKFATTLITAQRKPIAGFTQKELADITPNDPTLSIFMSNDTRFVPLKLEIQLAFGTASAVLVE